MKPLALLILALCLFTSAPARAALSLHDLAQIGASPPSGAAAPLGLHFQTEQGRPVTLGAAMAGRPTVLVFADYACTYLCGPGLVLTTETLDHTSLRPGQDYSLVVVGLDPRQGPAQAGAMRAARLHPGAGAAAQLLSAGPAAPLASALGYRYAYDAQAGQFVHDAVVYVLAPSGQVRRILPEFALTPASLEQALKDARAPSAPGPLAAPMRLVCACLQPLQGLYDGSVMAALQVGGIGVLLALAAAVVVLVKRREARG